MQEEIGAKLEAFVRENFLVRDDDEYFSRDVNLWEEGFVDSVGVPELIHYLEEAFECQIPTAAVFDPRFGSINGIAEIVARLVSK